MATNIPPLLSSTPPPLCDSDEEEDEEDNEFGMFNTTEELDYNDCPAFQTSNESKVYLSERTMPASETKRTEQDCTSQDSGLCPDSEGMSPTPHSDDERTYVKISASENILTNGFKDNFVNSDSQICKDLSSLSNVENDLVIPENENLEENDLKVPVLESNNLNTNNKITNYEKKEFCLHVIETDLGNKNTKDSADFDDFQHLENPSSPDQFIYPSVGLITNHIEGECESQAITFEKFSLPQTEQSVFNSTDTSFNKVNIVEDLVLDPVNILEKQENDDDFGDFHFESGNSCSVSYSFENNVNHEYKETFRSVETEVDEFSDFADFQECNFMSKENLNCEILPNVKSAPLFNEATDFNQDPIHQVSEDEDWNKLFPEKSNEEVESTYTNLTVEESNILKKLFPIETSPALSYQWNNSFANKMLLSSLNIDSRNILFMPWCNLSVPRFAANLGVGVLEPVKAPETLQSTVGFSISTTEETVPDAHFDWSSSGLINPLDYIESTSTLKRPLGSEAEKIIKMFPNLSYMKKTYFEFTTT